MGAMSLQDKLQELDQQIAERKTALQQKQAEIQRIESQLSEFTPGADVELSRKQRWQLREQRERVQGVIQYLQDEIGQLAATRGDIARQIDDGMAAFAVFIYNQGTVRLYSLCKEYNAAVERLNNSLIEMRALVRRPRPLDGLTVGHNIPSQDIPLLRLQNTEAIEAFMNDMPGWAKKRMEDLADGQG